MKVLNPIHKQLIASTFWNKGFPKEIPNESRSAAQSAYKKLISSEAGNVIVNGDEIEFTPSEIVIVKYLYDAKNDWPWNLEDSVKEELNNIFYPPQNVTTN